MLMDSILSQPFSLALANALRKRLLRVSLSYRLTRMLASEKRGPDSMGRHPKQTVATRKIRLGEAVVSDDSGNPIIGTIGGQSGQVAHTSRDPNQPIEAGTVTHRGRRVTGQEACGAWGEVA